MKVKLRHSQINKNLENLLLADIPKRNIKESPWEWNDSNPKEHWKGNYIGEYKRQ